MNIVHLIGNIGRDPKLEHTGGGTAVCNFSLATKERDDKTEWHNIRVWKKQAEAVVAKCGKGSLVAVTGRITTEKWTKDGQEKTMTRIVADRVEFLSLRAPSTSGSAPEQSSLGESYRPPRERAKPREVTGYGGYDDDVPF